MKKTNIPVKCNQGFGKKRTKNVKITGWNSELSYECLYDNMKISCPTKSKKVQNTKGLFIIKSNMIGCCCKFILLTKLSLAVGVGGNGL